VAIPETDAETLSFTTLQVYHTSVVVSHYISQDQ